MKARASTEGKQVVDSTNAAALERDFQSKSDYFQRNYGAANAANFLRRKRRDIIRRLTEAVESPNAILDVGCGPAILYPELLDQCQAYYALDLVEANLDRIRSTHPEGKVVTIRQDLDSFEWEGEPFDIVICSGSLEYTDYGLQNALRLTTYLRRPGFIVLSFPNALSLSRQWERIAYNRLWHLFNKLRGRRSEFYRRNLYHSSEVRRAMQTSLECDVKLTFLGHNFFLVPPLDHMFPKVAHRMSDHIATSGPRFLDFLCTEFVASAHV